MVGNALFNFESWLCHGILDDLIVVLVECFARPLVQLGLPVVHDFLQTVHKKLTDLRLPEIDDLDITRRVNVTHAFLRQPPQTLVGLQSSFFLLLDGWDFLWIKRQRQASTLLAQVIGAKLYRRCQLFGILQFVDFEFNLLNVHGLVLGAGVRLNNDIVFILILRWLLKVAREVLRLKPRTYLGLLYFVDVQVPWVEDASIVLKDLLCLI